MYKTFILFLVLLFHFSVFSQITIEGNITNDKGNPIPFVNVYLEDIYDGGSTDESGFYSFTTTATDSALLVASSVGLEKFENWIQLIQGAKNRVDIILSTGATELNEIVITAGSFEASDEKKTTILKPLDIVQNPVAAGDLYGAIATLPGVSKVGNETGLFVRGGEASETQTIIDGTIVDKPFFGEVPDVPSRGRFDPFLFKGTMFSTGGYSAEYGQALSSVLVLNTQDLPTEDSRSLSVNLAGIGLSATKVWNKKTAFLGSIGYTNLSPYFNLIPQRRDWTKPPEGFGGSFGFRHKTDKGGMFKSYFQAESSNIGVNLDNPNEATNPTPFHNATQNYYMNHSYSGLLNDQWSIFAALAGSKTINGLEIDQFSFDEESIRTQGKVTLKGALTEDVFLRVGGDLMYRNEKGATAIGSETYFGEWDGGYGAIYAETDVKLNKSIAIRVGVRAEYEQVIDDFAAAPRASIAFKTGKRSQMSFAYGTFYQTPETDFRRGYEDMKFESASHYILNYQWRTEGYTFRIETYYKDYKSLNRYVDFFNRNNSGDGYAKGIDIFWRDKETIQDLDYWISYSYVDGKRLYRNFPVSATPTFITNHTLSFVSKYNITQRMSTGLGYTFASGRPYENPNTLEFLDGRTIDYHNLTLNGSYLTNFFGHFTVIYTAISNPFGFDQVFDYRYSDDGLNRIAIVPSTKASAFIGLFISFQ